MSATKKKTDLQWAREQIKAYGRKQHLYALYADVLRSVLEKAAKKHAPLAIIQARPKTLPSFAEKIQRKIAKYRKVGSDGKPLHPITDLCGARVITMTLPEVKATSQFIEEHFDIDQANSLDVATRLKSSEFGYRSVHYIVRFRSGVFPTKDVPIKVPKSICGLDAEIQVRTVLEHAWAAFGHDICYKSPFRVPDKWQRELARLAAICEDVDDAFQRVQSGLQSYMASYGAYMSPQDMRAEIGRLQTVLKIAPTNLDAAHRIAKLAICLEDWQAVVNVLAPFAKDDNAAVLRDLGMALCKLHKRSPGDAAYRRGQQHLAKAMELRPDDSDAIASLAGTWKGLDEEKARALYRRAFEANPSDPYALGNFLESEIEYRRNLSPLSFAGPNLKAAIRKCRDQADVGMNLPWVFWDMGKFLALLEQPYASLQMYAKAVSVSSADWMIDTSLRSVLRLAKVKEAILGVEWARRFLVVASAARCGNIAESGSLSKLASADAKPLARPIVIVAGGCDAETKERIGQYRRLMLDAFRDFKGTLISGGTTTGVSGLVGDVGHAHPSQICTVGYVPQMIPSGVFVDRNKRRYREIRRSDGHGFSPLEPIQAWADIVAAGIPLSEVKLIGIDGGPIAAVEYRMALATGVRVGIISGSGGTADELLRDDDWRNAPNLFVLPDDPMTVRMFIEPGIPRLQPEIREALGQAIHEEYRMAQLRSGTASGISIATWDRLPEELKESNRHQADHISEKLCALGYSVKKTGKRNVALVKFTDAEIELMAEMEHARWNLERLLSGWRYADKKDVEKKLTPYLVSWANLEDDIREWDRKTVRAIPGFLAKVGLAVARRE
ncbi:MAG: hypothetical protein HZC54_02475 [Verrucomicrobia bacterium]|nr:hypothetical protein [Verrucomicrobiota bacterium]